MGFHISRWRYWWGYTVVFILVLAAIWFTDRAADAASWITGIVALISFIIFEFIIRRERIAITDSGVEVRRGIFKAEVTSIPYEKIAAVSTSQTVLQNVLRFGDVQIDTSSPAEIVLIGFEEPGKIERQISSRLHEVHEEHEHHKAEPHVGA
jgi:uncharacterized membrane protein YdbT with pleckstrin-like domain